MVALKHHVKRYLMNWFGGLPYYWAIYFKRHFRFPDTRNPARLSEKILRRMMQPDPSFSLLSDKVGVREYVARAVGRSYLIPVLGVFDRVDADVLKNMPERFVIKPNHGAGFVKIIDNAAVIDMGEVAKEVNSWLSIDYGKLYGEKHYSCIAPRVIIEESLVSDGVPPKDYKFNVFNSESGECFCFIQVYSDRGSILKRAIMLEDWTPAPFKMVGYPDNSDDMINERPDGLAEMLEVAKALAKPFGYCRVDLYYVSGKVYFSEMTFTPSASKYKFIPRCWDAELGKRFAWPENISI